MPGIKRSVVLPTLERGLALDGVDWAERVIGTILPARVRGQLNNQLEATWSGIYPT
jgi:hypothetical protein